MSVSLGNGITQGDGRSKHASQLALAGAVAGADGFKREIHRFSAGPWPHQREAPCRHGLW